MAIMAVTPLFGIFALRHPLIGEIRKMRSDACFRPASTAILPIWKRIVLEPSIVLNR
jgi:hypothetical protein